MNEKTKSTPPPGYLKTGKVEFVQDAAGLITLRFHQKPGVVVEASVSAGQLERWAIRQMREGVFA